MAPPNVTGRVSFAAGGPERSLRSFVRTRPPWRRLAQTARTRSPTETFATDGECSPSLHVVVMPPRPAIEIALSVVDATVPRRDLPLPASAGPAREAVTASVAA